MRSEAVYYRSRILLYNYEIVWKITLSYPPPSLPDPVHLLPPFLPDSVFLPTYPTSLSPCSQNNCSICEKRESKGIEN